MTENNYEDDHKLDEMHDQMNQLMDNQMEKLEATFKKAAVFSVLWSLIAVGVYFFAPDDWYFWVPTVIAIITTASFIFVTVVRMKIKNKLALKRDN